MCRCEVRILRQQRSECSPQVVVQLRQVIVECEQSAVRGSAIADLALRYGRKEDIEMNYTTPVLRVAGTAENVILGGMHPGVDNPEAGVNTMPCLDVLGLDD